MNWSFKIARVAGIDIKVHISFFLILFWGAAHYGRFGPMGWLFGIALICCGLNSTVTATMAGQIVMEGFIHLCIAAWARRLITRGIAIVPALITIYFFGAAQAGKLLVLSQVILSFQLPFAVVPLVLFTASKAKLGPLVAPRWLTAIAVVVAALIIGLNVKLIYDFLAGNLG